MKVLVDSTFVRLMIYMSLIQRQSTIMFIGGRKVVLSMQQVTCNETKLKKVGQKFLKNISVVAGLFCNLFAVYLDFIKLESFNPIFLSAEMWTFAGHFDGHL